MLKLARRNNAQFLQATSEIMDIVLIFLKRIRNNFEIHIVVELVI